MRHFIDKTNMMLIFFKEISTSRLRHRRARRPSRLHQQLPQRDPRPSTRRLGQGELDRHGPDHATQEKETSSN